MRHGLTWGLWSVRLAAAVGAVGISALANTARAADFSIDGKTYDVEAIVGSGSNEALLDINSDPTHSFLFGYEWNGTATGGDMLEAVAAASGGALQVGATNYGTAESPDLFVTTITYTTGGNTYGNPVYEYPYPIDLTQPYAWPGYFVSSDGVTFVPSEVGASGQTLADGEVDAWVTQTDPGDPETGAADIAPTPLVAVPEPATLAVFGVAGAALLRRRRVR